MTDQGVDPQFLRTLLASNAIWAGVTLTLTGIGGLFALVWRRRALKQQAAVKADLCFHCHGCHGHLRGEGTKHVLAGELCSSCAHPPPAAPPST